MQVNIYIIKTKMLPQRLRIGLFEIFQFQSFARNGQKSFNFKQYSIGFNTIIYSFQLPEFLIIKGKNVQYDGQLTQNSRFLSTYQKVELFTEKFLNIHQKCPSMLNKFEQNMSQVYNDITAHLAVINAFKKNYFEIYLQSMFLQTSLSLQSLQSQIKISLHYSVQGFTAQELQLLIFFYIETKEEFCENVESLTFEKEFKKTLTAILKCNMLIKFALTRQLYYKIRAKANKKHPKLDIQTKYRLMFDRYNSSKFVQNLIKGFLLSSDSQSISSNESQQLIGLRFDKIILCQIAEQAINQMQFSFKNMNIIGKFAKLQLFYQYENGLQIGFEYSQILVVDCASEIVNWMNRTSRVKSARQQPQYVLNVSIDIPLQSKYLVKEKAVQISAKISPKKNTRSSVTPLRKIANNLPLCSLSAPRKNLSACVQKSNNVNCNFRKSFSQCRAPSMELIPKKVKKKNIIKSARDYANLLKQFDSQNSVIRYTNNSNESAFKMYDQNLNSLLQQINYLQTPDNLFLNGLDVQEIRKYQRIANQKRQHLKFQYIKQTVLANASAKKIQRAWRKYRTSKLIECYSSRYSIKQKKNIFQTVQQADSYQIEKQNSSKHMQILDMDATPHLTRVQKNGLSSSSESYQNFDTVLITKKNSPFFKTPSETDSLQNEQISQEIKKWDELIKQIRAGKSLNQVLQKSYKRRAQLQKAIFSFNNHLHSIESYNQQNSMQQHQNFENQDRKIIDYQQKIRKIHEQIQRKQEEEKIRIHVSRQTLIDQGKREQLTSRRQKQYRQSEQIKAQLKLLSDLQNLRQYSELNEFEQTMKRKMESQNRQSSKTIKEIEQEKTQKIRPIHLKQFFKQDNIRPQVTLKSPISEQQGSFSDQEDFRQKVISESKNLKQDSQLEKKLNELSIIQRLELCKALMEQLIYDCLLDYSQSEKIVGSVKSLFQKKSKQQKWQGICTNLQSIKDYLQNLVAYILDYYLAQSMDSLNKSYYPTPLSLFNYIRKDELYLHNHFFEEQVLPLQIFNQHWAYVSDQIYFDRKYEDQEKQLSRVTHLKKLTQIYFRAIFDGFNESLQFARSYGVFGKPYPWESCQMSEKYNEVKVSMKQAYQRIISVSIVYCGLHLQGKRQKMPQHVIKDIQQQRLRQLLTLQMAQDQFKWQKKCSSGQLTKLLLLLSNSLQKALLNEFIIDLQKFAFSSFQISSEY